MRKVLDGITRGKLLDQFSRNDGPLTVPQLTIQTGIKEPTIRTALYRMMLTDGVVRSREKMNDPMGYVIPPQGFLLQAFWKTDSRLQTGELN